MSLNEDGVITTAEEKPFATMEVGSSTDFYLTQFGQKAHVFTVNEINLEDGEKNRLWSAYQQGQTKGITIGRKNLQADFKRLLEG